MGTGTISRTIATGMMGTASLLIGYSMATLPETVSFSRAVAFILMSFVTFGLLFWMIVTWVVDEIVEELSGVDIDLEE